MATIMITGSSDGLHDVLLAFGLARRWPQVLSNSVEPGWVAARRGGPGASDDLACGPVTQAWLAVSEEPAARVTGGYFSHRRRAEPHPHARRPDLQDQLLEVCGRSSGLTLA